MLSAQPSNSTIQAFQGNDLPEYSILTDHREIASLAPEWDALLAQSRCNRAFSCSKWYLATPYLLPELKPLVAVARRHGTLAGVFPLWLDAVRGEAGFPDDYSDHLDMIAADDDLEAITGLLSTVLRAAPGYSRLSLKHIKPDSNCVRAAQELGLCGGLKEAFAPPKALAYAVVDLTSGYDRFLRIENLTRFRKKAQREGIDVCELRPENFPPESLPELFFTMHRGRFGERSSLKSVCKSPEKWVHHLFPSLFAEKRMRVFALMQAGRIAGIDLVMVSRSGVYAWNGGFLPEMARYAPGKLLIDKTIQQCCLEGLAEYDLGWFGQEYKAYWKPAVRYIGELQFDLHP
jgi:CelD/BcsL family acetyltransferase involved in cellulose biosynthesis